MNTRWTRLLPVIGLIILSAGVYLQTLRYDFVWDDHQFISGLDATITDASHFLDYAKSAFLQTDVLTYRPAFLISYALDTLLWGHNAAGFHLTNILLHVLITLMVFRLSMTWTESSRVGWLSAAVFAVHPIHTEAVAWIAGRADLLVALFVLTALLSALRLSATWETAIPMKRLGWSVLIGASFVLALLSKETAIVLPGLILLSGLTNKTGSLKKIFPSLLITTMIASAYLLSRASILITVHSDVSVAGNVATMLHGSRSWFETILAAVYVTGDYIRLLAFPISVKALYDLPPLTITDPRIIQSAVILCAWVTGLGIAMRRSAVGTAAMGWVLIGLAPTYALFIYTSVSPLAERLLYLPSIGFALLLGLLLSAGYEFLGPSEIGRTAVSGLTICLLSVYGISTILYNAAWTDDLHLWRNTVRNNPQNSLAHYNLSMTYLDQQRWPEAIKESEKIISIKPAYPEAYFNIANSYVALNRRDRAITYYQTAIRFKPDYADAYINLAVTYHELGQDDLAQKSLELAVQYNPRSPVAHNNLANVYALQGRWKNAIDHYEKALALRPDYPEARSNLDSAYRSSALGAVERK